MGLVLEHSMAAGSNEVGSLSYIIVINIEENLWIKRVHIYKSLAKGFSRINAHDCNVKVILRSKHVASSFWTGESYTMISPTCTQKGAYFKGISEFTLARREAHFRLVCFYAKYYIWSIIQLVICDNTKNMWSYNQLNESPVPFAFSISVTSPKISFPGTLCGTSTWNIKSFLFHPHSHCWSHWMDSQ